MYIEEFISYGLGGLEVYYPAHNEEQMKFLENICNIKGLLATGGSDFHGSSSKCAIGEFEISKEKAQSLSMQLLKLAKNRK
jgi:predicted metal-dependent phosphoesterase TrpH